MQAQPARGRSYSFNEWCRLRNLSRTAAYRLIRDGELTTYKVGLRRYITEAADREFIERKEREAAA